MAALESLFGNPLGTPTFVLDAALVPGWLLSHRWTAYGNHVFRKMTAATVVVPKSWPTELAQMLRDDERRGLITPPETARLLAGIDVFRFGIDVDSPAVSWDQTLALARTHRLRVARAGYLELALRLALPLATIDTTLIRHAYAAGVPIYAP